MKLPLVLLLCAAASVSSQPPPVGYHTFVNQHFYARMTENACDTVIAQREIYVPIPYGNNCKDTNTFIYNTNLDRIQAICRGAGTAFVHRGRALFRSNQPFPIITCTLRRGIRRPHCEYRGHRSTRYIAIACDGIWPTHYDNDIVVV